MTASPREVLIAARKLIEKEENWCQGAWNRYGRHCAHGAILAATDDGDLMEAATDAFEGAAGWPILGFNDRSTHAEVLAAFDKAIAECPQ